jgi:dimeric dUTPase (all-alpha-NTP-PPase superfamily)
MSKWEWLETTRQLQIKSYGTDPITLSGDKLANFWIWNHTAAIDELSEFLNEVTWKPWSTQRGTFNRDAAIGELVDCAHFIANLAVSLGCTDGEWESRYQAKQLLNAKRQQDGYDGKNKCPNCKRALDDPGVQCTPDECAYQ